MRVSEFYNLGRTQPTPEYEYQGPAAAPPTNSSSTPSEQVDTDSETDSVNEPASVVGAKTEGNNDDDSGAGWGIAALSGLGLAGWWAVRYGLRLKKAKTS